MRESIIKTMGVPQITATAPENGDVITPGTIVTEAKRPLRVIVRNISVGSFVLIAYDPVSIAGYPAAANSYKLPAGERDEFFVAPGQGLYMASPGVSEVCVAISDAVIPVEAVENVNRR